MAPQEEEVLGAQEAEEAPVELVVLGAEEEGVEEEGVVVALAACSTEEAPEP